MDDYVNDGAAFDNQEEILDPDTRLEKAKIEESYPVIEDFIAHLNKAIVDGDSLSALGITSDMPQIQVQIIMEGHKKFLALLQTELDNVKELKERYLG